MATALTAPTEVPEASAETGPPQPQSVTGAPRNSQIVAHVRDLFYRARAERRPLVNRWVRNYNILHNRTWQADRASHLPDPQVPEMWPIVASAVGWMTDQRPIADVQPAIQPFLQQAGYVDQLAQDLSSTLRATHQTLDLDSEYEQMLWDAHTYGIAFSKTFWDSKLNDGLGDAVTRRLDPFMFYPDPLATSMDDAQFFVEVRQVPISEIELTYGKDKADDVRDNLIVEAVDTAPTILSGPTPQRPKTNPSPYQLVGAGTSPSTTPTQFGLPNQSRSIARLLDHELVTVIECWIREIATIKRDIPTDNGSDEEETTVPRWRCIVISGSTVLLDEPALNLFSHGQHPYDRLVLVETGEFWGEALVTLLAPMQLSINRLLAALEQNLWLAGNPVMVDSNRSGIGRTTITNKPGTRLTKNQGAEVAWLTPPEPNPQTASNLIQFYKSEMENVSGLSAMVRGFNPTGRNSQGVLESVQDAAFVRVRLALRNLERCIRRMESKRAALIIDFYDTPRIVALSGDDGERSALALKALHWWLPSGKGRIPMRYQLIVQAGSALPTSREARAAQAQTLFALGIVDEEAVLEAMNLPGWKRTLARVREQKAAAGTLGMPPGARQRTRT